MAEQPNERQTDQTRGADGKFARDPATAERDAEAARLRGRGLSYRAIAAELGMSSSGSAYEAVQRALRAIVEEPAQDVRTLELARLDELYAAVMAVLERQHITVSQGRIVRRRVLDDNGDPIVVTQDKDGKPVFREEEILDDGPVLAAADRLLRIQERRSKLLGLDMPTRVSVDAENIGREIGELLSTLGGSDDGADT